MPCHMQIIFQLHFVRVVCEIHLLCINLQCVHLYSHLLSQLHVHLHLHLSRILCVCVNHQSSFFFSPPRLLLHSSFNMQTWMRGALVGRREVVHWKCWKCLFLDLSVDLL